MKETKFRVWDSKEKKMFYFDYYDLIDAIGNDQCDRRLYRLSETHQHDRSDDIVMQFTGMQDKNNVDIFHKDICKIHTEEYYSNESISLEDGESLIGKICFHDGCFWLSSKDNTQIALPEIIYNEIKIEVLGSIYENSELLKEHK